MCEEERQVPLGMVHGAGESMRRAHLGSLGSVVSCGVVSFHGIVVSPFPAEL